MDFRKGYFEKKRIHDSNSKWKIKSEEGLVCTLGIKVQTRNARWKEAVVDENGKRKLSDNLAWKEVDKMPRRFLCHRDKRFHNMSQPDADGRDVGTKWSKSVKKRMADDMS